MNIGQRLDNLHLWFKQNRWMWIFTIGTRLSLVVGFLGAGIVKIMGERFTDLHNLHPMGQYLQAVYETGYYYTFIGVMQVIAAILLLIPRTVILGVFIYLPIILNICILSWSVRFDGSLFTSPLMVIACLYLLWWHYDRVKYILPFKINQLSCALPKQKMNNKFPWVFALFVAATLVGVTAFSATIFEVMPRNTIEECKKEFENTNRTTAGVNFCDCVHTTNATLDACIEQYDNTPDDDDI